jgi:dTDP-4-amino-4,6-dideoxygalactose transaminase
MDTIMALAGKHGLDVVEDCAQAIGVKWEGKAVGSFGDTGCFSFFPSKNPGAVATSPNAPNANLTTVYHQFAVQIENRGQIQQSLSQAGVSSVVYYPVPLHLQRVYANPGHSAGSFSVAEQARTWCRSLPMFPHRTDEQIQTSATPRIEAVFESRTSVAA